MAGVHASGEKARHNDMQFQDFNWDSEEINFRFRVGVTNVWKK